MHPFFGCRLLLVNMTTTSTWMTLKESVIYLTFQTLTFLLRCQELWHLHNQQFCCPVYLSNVSSKCSLIWTWTAVFLCGFLWSPLDTLKFCIRDLHLTNGGLSRVWHLAENDCCVSVVYQQNCRIVLVGGKQRVGKDSSGICMFQCCISEEGADQESMLWKAESLDYHILCGRGDFVSFKLLWLQYEC